MRLSPRTEGAMRILIFTGVHRDREVRIREIADAYHMPLEPLEEAHSLLTELGLIRPDGSDGEGLRLAVEPDEIRVGWLIRHTEDDLSLVECFDRAENTCPITPACMLRHIFHEARSQFLRTLDGFTVADCLASPRRAHAFVHMWTKASWGASGDTDHLDAG